MSTRPDSEGKSGKRSGPAWLGKRQGGGRVKEDPDWKKAKVVKADVNAGYKLKRALLWIVCLTLFGVFMYYLIPPRNTPLVIFRAAPYPLSMPPLALAKEDSIFLTQVSPSNLRLRKSVLFTRKEADQSSDDGSPQQLLTQLKDVKPSGPGWFSRSGNVVIYIAAHGLVNDAGEACLVPPTASPFEPEDWLPVTDLLREICKLPNLQRARKIVILDCNRIGTRWRSGVLDNRFADRLKASAEAVANDDLYILSSASPGQVAWSAPELRGSVFGHFVGLGLRGDASLEHGRDQNRGVVSLKELYKYLEDRVDDYVQQRRGVRQQPLLIGPRGQMDFDKIADVPVVSGDYWQGWRSMEQLKSPHDVLAKAKELIDPAGQNGSPVQAAWEAYQRRTDGTITGADRADSLPLTWRYGFVLDPIRFATLEQKMMALEERLVAGEDYQEPLRGQWEVLADELADKNWRPFPTNQAVTNLKLEEWQRLAQEVFNEKAADRTTEFQALFQTWRDAKTPEERNAVQFLLSERNQATQAMFYRFGLDGSANPTRDPFDKSQLQAISEFLQIIPRQASSVPNGNEPETASYAAAGSDLVLPIEGHFLRLLRGNVSEPAQRQLREAIEARSWAERAATPNDVRAHYALEGLVNEADAERRQAEDAFFMGDDVSVDGNKAPAGNDQVVARSAAQRWLRAVGSETEVAGDNANKGYKGAHKWARELESMFLLRDQIWARMPHFAEWFYRRSRLELARSGLSDESRQSLQSNQGLLAAVMSGNVRLAEQLEDLLKARGMDAQLRSKLDAASKTYDELQANWQALLQLAGRDASIIVDAEGRFETQDAVRRVELLMQTPLVVDARATQLLAKYRNTLEFWSQPENALARSKTKSAAKGSANSEEADAALEAEVDKVFLPQYRDFWVNYHRLLTHKFIADYKDHLELLKIGNEYKLDEELRKGGNQAPVWLVLNRLLRDYDDVFSKKASVLAPNAKDITAREELSQWDRRVRANAFWLPCVDAAHVSPVNVGSFPAARLRAVDHWHLTCWHAYRLLHDFWGNGLLNDRQPQYFEVMTKKCESALATSALPFRYEIPGEHVEPLADLLKKRVAAYRGAIAFKVDDVKALDPASPMPLKFEARIQQDVVTPGQDPVRFPAGRAGFFIARPLTMEPLPPESATWGDPSTLHRAEVPLKDVDRGPLPKVTIPASLTADQFPKLKEQPEILEGRVWYRGHIWSDQFELYYSGPARGIRLVHEAKKYSAPSVQVIGDDAPSGAVMFVLDCSRSMRLNPKALPGAVAPFNLAKRQFKAVLDNLKGLPDLKIGLMAYAHRTPTADGEAFYRRTMNWNGREEAKPGGGAWADEDWLTDAGIAKKAALGEKAFVAQYPHPDRDVQELVPPKTKWEADLDLALDDQALNALTLKKCLGETPLYYAIAEAISRVQKVEDVDTRQVIVITDGVNFPYGGTDKARKPTAKAQEQNVADLTALRNALENLRGVKVRIVLFGDINDELDAAQLKALQAASKSPDYVVDIIPSPDSISESIQATFERTRYSVVAPEQIPASDDWRPFDKVWIYPQWPAPRDLLQTPSQRTVEVKGPRVRDKLAMRIELSGGEAISLEYKARPQQLLFKSEGLSPFKISTLEAIGNADPFVTPVVAEILKPEPPQPFEETQDTIATMFRIRLRSQGNDAFVRRPKYVWAEIQPNHSDPKYQKLMFQISDLRFMEKTSTPVLEFIVPQWPKAVRSAKINLWVRYTAPPSALEETVRFEVGETNFPQIVGKADLDGVTFRFEQQRVEGVKRIVKVIESHPTGTPLAKLYRTRVQLSPPAKTIERMYIPADNISQSNGEVVHTFTYEGDYLNDRLTLEVNSPEKIKESSLRLEGGMPLPLPSWNP